jgi:predicted membrane protein
VWGAAFILQAIWGEGFGIYQGLGFRVKDLRRRAFDVSLEFGQLCGIIVWKIQGVGFRV